MPHSRWMHCFCLGAAKTGTTSFAEMFSEYYRAAHEPEVPDLTAAVARVVRGEHTEAEVVAWLQRRHRRLDLDVEASHPLGYMAPWLPQVFPEARFIITLREPLAWLKSRLDYHFHKTPAEWQAYRDLIWGRWHQGYHPEEAILEGMGLYSIDAYLSQYTEQYEILFKNLPQERCLIINTAQLNDAVAPIADFLRIHPHTVKIRHANALTAADSIIDKLAPDFVRARVQEKCGWLRQYL
jgi:hypothetical protein